jgi:hypothetical protein
MYWKTIHMLLRNDRSTNELPPLHDPFNSFNLAYDATQKSNVLNKYFCSITKLNDDDASFSRKDLLNKLHNGFDISSFTDTNILLLIISGPTALLALRVHNISITSCSSNDNLGYNIFTTNLIT